VASKKGGGGSGRSGNPKPKELPPPDLLEVDCKPDKKDKNTFLCRVVSREQNPRDRKATSPKNARERFLLNTLDKHKPSKQQWLDVAPDLLLATDVVAAMEDVLDPVIFSRLQNGIKQSWENLHLDRPGFKAAMAETMLYATRPTDAARLLNPKVVSVKGDFGVVDALYDKDPKPSQYIRDKGSILVGFLSDCVRPIALSLDKATPQERGDAIMQMLTAQKVTTLEEYGQDLWTTWEKKWDGGQESPPFLPFLRRCVNP
jgi:hypothetical protein